MDIWQILMTPFSWLLKQFCLLFNSYAVALLLFTIVVKLILAPFQFKGKKSMIKMNILSAQQKEIQERYRNDPNKMNMEIQKLYAENGVNPMGGCLWSMIPMFILFPLYAIIRRPLKYMMWLTEEATVAVAGALGWASAQGSEFVAGAGTSELILASMFNSGNLGTASAAAGSDSLFLINFNFLGIDLSRIPQMRFWEGGITPESIGLFLLPVISAGLALLSMVVMTRTNAMNQQQAESAKSQNRMMMIMQPVLSLWIGFTLPAGMCIYWISNSVLTMAQEQIFGRMLKKDYEEAQRKIAEQAAASKAAEKERRRAAAQKKAAALEEKKSGKKKSGGQTKKKEDGPALDKSASRVGMRQYARGRAYDPDRYPITPYRDPNAAPIPDEEPGKEPEELTEEEKALLAESPAAEQAAPPAEAAPAEASEAAEEPEGTEAPDETPRFDTPTYDKPNFDGKQ